MGRIVECKSLAWALSWNTHMLEAKLQSLRTCQGQMPEDKDEAEDNLSRPRSRPRTKFRPRGQSGLEDLTSLASCGWSIFPYNKSTKTNRINSLCINQSMIHHVSFWRMAVKHATLSKPQLHPVDYVTDTSKTTWPVFCAVHFLSFVSHICIVYKIVQYSIKHEKTEKKHSTQYRVNPAYNQYQQHQIMVK